MKRFLTALALLGCVAGTAQGDYLVIRVNLGLPPLPPKEKPKTDGPAGFMMGQGRFRRFQPPPQNEPPVKKVPNPGDKKEKTVNSSPLAIIVFLEYEKAQKVGQDFEKDIRYTLIKHKWGRTFLAFDQHIVQVKAFQRKKSVAQQYKDLREEAFRPAGRTARGIFDLAEWTLVHNVTAEKRNANDQPGPEFPNVMAELVKLNAKTPVTEPEIKKALAAYGKVTEDLQKPIDQDDIKYWKEKLGMGKVAQSEHYALLYDSDTTSRQAPPEVRSRLDRLEQNYQQFYWWFALRGQVLPIPKKKLLAVLIDSPQEFRKYYEAFDPVPLVTDGFYARRENIVFFSGSRLDGTSDAFNKHVSELIRNGWDFKAMLKGQRRTGKTGEEVAYAQTMALIHKCLQEESEIASVTHEGTRQLLVATGILPRGVILPEWVQFGFPSAFETPKYDPYTRTGAFYPMFAGPSWTYLVKFKLLTMDNPLKLKELDQELANIVSDFEFRNARTQADLLRARTMAWSLSYYLFQRRLDGLHRFGQELAQLPHDLEFDADVYFHCFARAFGLEDAKGKLDAGKMHDLAADWYKFIGETTPPPLKEAFDEAKKAHEERREKSGAKGP